MKELDTEDMPFPLLRAYIRFDEEIQDFKKLHRLLDAIEVLVKVHTVIIVSDYFSRTEPSEKLKGLLAAGLKKPSLGIWWQFARDICMEKMQNGEDFFASGIEKFVGAKNKGYDQWKGALNEAMQAEDNLISFRNKYAHGATPPDDECRADFTKFEKVFRELILGALHFREVCIVGIGDDGKSLFPKITAVYQEAAKKVPKGPEMVGRCYALRQDGQYLNLHPLLFLRPQEEDWGKPGFFFYNDLREKEASMLEYDACGRWRDESMRKDLLGAYPIDSWKKHTDSEIQATIDRLTEAFKGRVSEINQILEFIARPKGGPLLIWGGPGIGKSSLLARTTQALAWSSKERRDENFTALGAVEKVYVVKYFIRRSGQTNDTEKMLHHLNDELEKFAKTKLDVGYSSSEMADAFKERLRRFANRLKDDERLVVFVDGLDEGTDAAGLFESLPREVPEKVALIYSSREIPLVRSRIWEEMDRERRSEIIVQPMGQSEIRALLSDFVNKYALEQEYLSRVVSKSQGNPLYLKLLCQGLERGDYQLNDTVGLPKEIKSLYDDMLTRYNSEHNRALEYLTLLAQAKFFLADEVAAALMDCSQADVESIVHICRESLFENAETETVDDYQLFHESLREYLLDNKPGESEKKKRLFAEWCQDWNKGEKTILSRKYAIEYRIEHAKEWKECLEKSRKNSEVEYWNERIVDAMEDGNFRRELFLSCGHAETLRNSIRTAQGILLSGGLKNHHRILALARIYQEEPLLLAQELIEELECSAENLDFEKVAENAEFGTSEKQKAMLALRGIWKKPGQRTKIHSIALSTKMNDWIKNSDDEDLRELVELSSITTS